MRLGWRRDWPAFGQHKPITPAVAGKTRLQTCLIATYGCGRTGQWGGSCNSSYRRRAAGIFGLARQRHILCCAQPSGATRLSCPAEGLGCAKRYAYGTLDKQFISKLRCAYTEILGRLENYSATEHRGNPVKNALVAAYLVHAVPIGNDSETSAAAFEARPST